MLLALKIILAVRMSGLTHAVKMSDCSRISILCIELFQNILFIMLWAAFHNWLTPWSRVLPEKLTGPWLVKKYSTFYVNWTFIATFTWANNLPLYWARSMQSMPPPSHVLKTILIVFQVVFFPQVSQPQPCMHPSCFPYKFILKFCNLMLWHIYCMLRTFCKC